jgi:hypothetical protein
MKEPTVFMKELATKSTVRKAYDAQDFTRLTSVWK